LWGLASQRETIIRQLGEEEGASQQKTEEFTHAYYQGLIVEIGNWKGCQTFVAHQDKNKVFLSRKLSEIITLHDVPDFTYASLLKRARTVDVIWFNTRRFPDSLFEVEHSTDFYHSLLKFVEFQDFRVNYYVVADAARQSEFEGKISHGAFDTIRPYVQFLNYEALSDYHSKISATVVAAKRLNL